MSARLLFLDVDGTLTDGKIYTSDSGELFKSFNVKDGYGINVVCKENNIIPIIITARSSEIVKKRADEIGISEIYQGISDKLACVKAVMDKYGLDKGKSAYIGDDIPDLCCMEYCGYSGCPADAIDKVKEQCNFVCKARGGDGAVREFIEKLLSEGF